MPNRIIKDSIRTSKSVNAMTDFQFRLWVYLITYVDDYGRGSADPELLKGFVFPRRKGVTESSIEKALADLANSGSVTLYEVDGEPYFCFPNWGAHQRIQTKKSKFPAPIHGDPRYSTVTHGDSPPESNPNPESEYESEYEDYSAEPDAVSAPPVVTLPLNDGSEYPIFMEQADEWAGLYPAVDVIQQLRTMRGWLSSNPTRRKTKRGILRFVNSWLAKEQDKGPKALQQAPQQGKKDVQAPSEAELARMKKLIDNMRNERGQAE